MSECENESYKITEGKKCNRCKCNLTPKNICRDFDHFCSECRAIKETEWTIREHNYRYY